MTQFSDLNEERIPETGYRRADFEWADKITRLCDNAAFYFCFEGEWERKAAVCPKVGSDEAVEIEYCVEENGRLSITPWPFSVPIIMGNILGFQADRYPEQLNPIVVPFHIYEQKRS